MRGEAAWSSIWRSARIRGASYLECRAPRVNSWDKEVVRTTSAAEEAASVSDVTATAKEETASASDVAATAKEETASASDATATAKEETASASDVAAPGSLWGAQCDAAQCVHIQRIDRRNIFFDDAVDSRGLLVAVD